MAFLSFDFRKTDRTMPMLTHPAWRMTWSPEARAALHVPRAEQISSLQLASLVDQIQSVTLAAKEIVLRRSRADVSTRPKPSSWSVAECFGHLALTTRAFLPAISDALAKASNLTTNRPLETGILTRLFILNLEPPYAFRFNVLPQLRPQAQDFDEAWGGFLESQSHLLDILSSSGGLAIDKVKIGSPVYARMSYTVYGAFRMLTAHQRRHLWQITQILRALDRRRTLRTAL
jgi:DinB superfamily